MRIEPTVASQGRYDLTPDQRIGLICLPELVLEIRPKVPMSSVLFLISYGADAASWFDEQAEFGRDIDLVEIVAMMLARAVEQATRRGLLNGYRGEDESLQAPRGRILFDEQIRRWQGRSPPIEVRHDVFTSDVLENRLLLAALDAFGRMPLQASIARRELSRAQRLFGAVRRLHYAPSAVPDVVFSRVNRHYQKAIALASLVLRSASLDIGTGGSKASALLIDMNEVFERFVRIALRAALGTDELRFPDRAPPIHLDEVGVVPLKPDLCFVRGRRIVWVGDAKYKRLPVGAYRNADLYQLLAYVTALDLGEGTLVYAADEGVSAAEHVVVRAGKRLRVIALDLRAPRGKILQQVGAIAARIAGPVAHAA
jgi:5-methylcytosine-specific restriction enzyme subunit McrC